MIERRWHTMIAIVANVRYYCRRCKIETDLAGAVEHVVANQEIA